MEFRKQSGRFVAGWKQHPLIKVIPLCEFEQVRRLSFAVYVQPGQSPLRVARIACELYVWRACDPNGHTTTAQTPGDRKTIEVSPYYQCSCCFSHGRKLARDNAGRFLGVGLTKW